MTRESGKFVEPRRPPGLDNALMFLPSKILWRRNELLSFISSFWHFSPVNYFNNSLRNCSNSGFVQRTPTLQTELLFSADRKLAKEVRAETMPTTIKDHRTAEGLISLFKKQDTSPNLNRLRGVQLA